ncbi:MAG: hypothetical protein RL105_1015 [Verrucomicrobiota bacterium]|jgi:hypothetical protein
MSDDSAKKRPPADDDRNLVVVDEDFQNADAEDRLWLFWERNKALIVRGSSLVILGILAAIGHHFWQEARREEVGAEYAACQDEAARRAFAARHPGDPLSAVALAEVGDDLKRSGKLAEAAKAYDEAAAAADKAGDSTVVRSLALRARLYAGLTRSELGEKGAEAAVAAIADEPSAPETVRGFAMLSLANLAIARGDSAEAAKWLNAMDKRLRPGSVWQSDKAFLVRSEPSLTNAPAAK